jgi:hypothetical protein
MLILVLLGGFWTLNRQLTKIEVSLRGKVSYGDCANQQEKCPCHKEIEEIKQSIKFFHQSAK